MGTIRKILGKLLMQETKAKKEPEFTPIQHKIEEIVTNRLGYHPRTSYVPGNSLTTARQNDYLHDTQDGLRIHLAELELTANPNPELEKLVSDWKALTVRIHKDALENLPIYNDIILPNVYLFKKLEEIVTNNYYDKCIGELNTLELYSKYMNKWLKFR